MTTNRVDIAKDLERFADRGVLGTLLADRSTGGNIIWASNAFSDKGEGYAPENEIFVRDFTGENAGIIRTRASKGRDDQAALTKAYAEVFTPLWVVRKMVDAADDAWYEAHAGERALAQRYIGSRRLEIACGEAPFLCTRYDAANGTNVPVYRRSGVLDRKLMEVTARTTCRKSWIRLALKALKSTYGYEYQGDNLLIARVNVLATMEDFLDTAGWDPYTPEEYRQLAEVISWNLWQMDGLTDCVPNRALWADGASQMRLLSADGTPVGEQMEMGITTCRGVAKVFDWESGYEVEFRALKREVTLMDNGPRFKFDYIIGNPPYQDETNGDSRNYAPPIYHLFMDACFTAGNAVELIHPARFLFNAGSTPKKWNEKMLKDEHFKVLWYEEDGHKVFPTLSTPLRGGVAITYRDANARFGAIQAFTKYPEVNDILHKVVARVDFRTLMDIVYSRTSYRLTDVMHQEHPEAITKVSKGHTYDMSSNIMQLLPEIFFEDKPTDGNDYIRILGRLGGKRIYRYIRRDYVRSTVNLDHYKLYVAQANGSGEFGETMSEPVVEGPAVGATETFLSIGSFETKFEAEAVARYVKTKFARTLLSVLKVTQNGNKPVWRMIPLQDFTSTSDIDWSQPIPDIDRQLYAKYGLSQSEVDFIESHVKEME